MRFPDSPVARHHRATYGDRPYADFVPEFEAGLDQWDPEAWARSFADAGARYVVLVAKHHDGYCLWPTSVPNPHRPGWHSRRDVVGELADAVRAEGLRFGLYYSGGLDWTFDDRPLGSVADVVAAMPRGDYPDYAEAQVRELIERYRPSVLWNDITWPTDRARLFELFDHYYRAVPDGVVNDRWMPWSPAMGVVRHEAGRRLVDASAVRSARRGTGFAPPMPPHFDVRTPEYSSFSEVQRHAWECVRGMDHSFGYNAASLPEDFLSRDELVWMVADIVATGGNLLLNVGPRGVDATIPDEQLERFGWLGRWTGADGRSIYSSAPWVQPSARSAEGDDLRYWSSGEHVWVAVGPGSAGEQVTVPGVAPTPTTSVWDADGVELRWSSSGTSLRVELAPAPPGGVPVRVFRLDRVDARA